MSVKWRYFTVALAVNVITIFLGEVFSSAKAFWIIPMMFVIATVMMLVWPEQRNLGRFFMWGTLASIPLIFILFVILMIASGVHC